MSKSQKEKSMTKDELVGMKVIDCNGNLAGTVKDVAFVIGKTGISLSILNKASENQEIPWEQVQAVGDFIVLKPPAQALNLKPSEKHLCPTCTEPLNFIQQYQRWYCYRCKKYA